MTDCHPEHCGLPMELRGTEDRGMAKCNVCGQWSEWDFWDDSNVEFTVGRDSTWPPQTQITQLAATDDFILASTRDPEWCWAIANLNEALVRFCNR